MLGALSAGGVYRIKIGRVGCPGVYAKLGPGSSFCCSPCTVVPPASLETDVAL